MKILLTIFLFSSVIFSQEKEKIEYKYKKEDYFDFDALEVQGQLMTPGDITSNLDKQKRFDTKSHIRKKFDDYIREDLIDIH